MANKPLKKANSPVKKTGQNCAPQKRLLKATPEELANSREKILIAARGCFARQGFAGTSMNDIQMACGFSRGNLYHHFKTKEEIVHIIISQNLGRFCDQVEATLTSSNEKQLSFKSILKELASLAEIITKGPGKGMAFHVWSLAMVDLEVRETMQLHFEKIRSALEKQIILQKQRGVISKNQDSKKLSVALFGIVIPGFTVQSVFMDEMAINSEDYVEGLAALIEDV